MPMDSSELAPYAPRILADLVPFLASTSEDTLALIVETLTVTVKINLGSWLTTDATRALTRVVVLEAWRKNSKGKPLAIRLESFLLKRVCVVDPVLLSALTDLLSAIAASLADGIYNALVAEAFPPLVEILGPRASEDGGEVWLVSSALELIVSILEGGEKGKLGDGLVAGLAPALLDCLGRTQDRDVIVVCANPPFPYRSVISNLPWLLLTDCLILFTLTRKGLNASLSLYGKPVTSYWPGTTMQVRTGFKSLLPSSLVSCPRKRTKRLAY